MEVDGDPSSRNRRGAYRKSESTKERILAAALDVFAARGYRSSSLREIGESCGLDQTSILYHFPTKSALLLAVMQERDRRADETLLDPAADPDTVDVLLRLAARNQEVPGVIELYTVLAAESLTPDHPLSDYFHDRTRRVRAGFRESFAEMSARNLLADGVDPAAAADALFALWDGLQLHWLLTPDEVDIVGTLRHFLGLVLKAPHTSATPSSPSTRLENS